MMRSPFHPPSTRLDNIPLSEALLRSGPLSLAGLATFPGVRALGSVRPQPDEAEPITAVLTPASGSSSTSDLGVF